MLEWSEEFREFPMLQRGRPMDEMLRPDGLTTWWVVHLATGADHLYTIRLPAACSSLLYDHISGNSTSNGLYKYDWTKQMVEEYIEDAYHLLNRQRPSDPDQQHPSDDLLVLDLFWRRFY
jgi:hypothetical protein